MIFLPTTDNMGLCEKPAPVDYTILFKPGLTAWKHCWQAFPVLSALTAFQPAPGMRFYHLFGDRSFGFAPPQ